MNATRRTALAAIACGALFPVRAAPRPRKRLAIVHFGNPADWKDWVDPFALSLARLGFAEGRDIEILKVGLIPDVPKTGPETMARQATERVLPLQPDVIVTTGPIVTYILSLATKSIPIVTQHPDPVGSGLAGSLAKPGGNVTGLADGAEETAVKVVEIMKQLVPGLARLAIFTEARPNSIRFAGHFERAAASVGLGSVTIKSNEHAELLAAIRTLKAKGLQAGLWSWAMGGHPRHVGQEALVARVPLFGPEEAWVRHGCVASYRGYEPVPQERLATIAALVLRGTSPGEIPFQLPQRFRLAINRRSAEALGLAIPPELLLRADEVFG